MKKPVQYRTYARSILLRFQSAVGLIDIVVGHRHAFARPYYRSKTPHTSSHKSLSLYINLRTVHSAFYGYVKPISVPPSSRAYPPITPTSLLHEEMSCLLSSSITCWLLIRFNDTMACYDGPLLLVLPLLICFFFRVHRNDDRDVYMVL